MGQNNQNNYLSLLHFAYVQVIDLSNELCFIAQSSKKLSLLFFTFFVSAPHLDEFVQFGEDVNPNFQWSKRFIILWFRILID